jgi:hypothetical protein
MAERVRARDLLCEAQRLYDDRTTGLAAAVPCLWRAGFASGGEWMRRVLTHLRGVAPPGPTCNLHCLGVVKYSLASAAALACVAAAWLLGQPLAALLVVPAFYAVEAQMVFLFPLALDGSPAVFRAARAMAVQAGGTLAVMRTVLPLAAVMLGGGFAGRGFVRSWCLGCLAVCLWYERVRASTAAPACAGAGSP